MSNPKTEIEWIQKKSRETPGPSDYADFSLKDASDRASGGKISTAKPKTETEILMLRSAETPGPNQCMFSRRLGFFGFVRDACPFCFHV